MKCADCKRELEVGDQYIQFTASEWAKRSGLNPLDGMDDMFADIMGSDHGDQLVYCEACTTKTDDGWMFSTVYGDEDDAA